MRRSSHRWRRWPARPDDVRDDSRKRRAGVRPFPGLAATGGRDLGIRFARPPTPDAAAAAHYHVVPSHYARKSYEEAGGKFNWSFASLPRTALLLHALALGLFLSPRYALLIVPPYLN